MSASETGTVVKTRKSAVRGKSFLQRNPVPIGAIGMAVLAALMFAGFNAAKLPIIGGGTIYHAAFSESAGLQPGNEVRVAGVKVGTVGKLSLEGDHVVITFKVKHAFIGDQSTVGIKLKTLLGAKYLSIDSIGDRKQDPKQEIPINRTVAPLDVYPAFQQLTTTVQDINTTELAKAFSTLSDTFRNTPASTRKLIDGLSRLSTTIASRDTELRALLSEANKVTGVLADRSQVLVKLIDDGSLLLDELHTRRDAIHNLFINTQALTVQLQGLVDDNKATIGPMLSELGKVLDLLEKNLDNLDRSLATFAPFLRLFTNVAGNGRWFDNYIQNLNIGCLLGGTGSVCG